MVLYRVYYYCASSNNKIESIQPNQITQNNLCFRPISTKIQIVSSFYEKFGDEEIFCRHFADLFCSQDSGW